MSQPNGHTDQSAHHAQQGNGDPRRTIPLSSSSYGSQPPLQPSASGEMPYDDPTNLLRVYPFATYQPTARTAMHFSSHTTTYPSPSSSAELYPQHADAFQRIDRPATAEDWAMRTAMESRVREMMNSSGPSYLTSHLPTPDSSTFTHQPHQQYTAYPMDIAPLPYSFLPSYMPPEPLTEPPRPPTPISIADPHTPSSPMHFFNNFISTTLDRANQGSSPPNTDDGPPTPSHHRSSSVATAPSSVSSTPSLARAMSRAHFTPEASPGPSPSKKQKIGQFSPTPRTKSLPSSNIKKVTLKVGSSSQPLTASSSLTSIGSSASTPKGNSGSRTLMEVEIPVRGKSQAVEDEEESEEDDLDWDEEPTIDVDGDWNMENEIGRKSSERWDARGAPPGSGRTGDRDARTHFQKLQSLWEDIFEESDSFPAEPSSQDLVRSKYFGTLSPQSGQPILSDKTVEKVTRYFTTVQKGKRRQASDVVEWNTSMVASLLRLLERSMAGVDSIKPFPNDKKAIMPKKKKKGKKEKTGSASPELEDEEPSEEQPFTEAEVSHGQSNLEAFTTAGLAAECCLTIMDTENISKQLLSEDIVSMAVAIVKDQMAKIIIPVVECLGGDKTSSRFLEHIVLQEQAASKKRLQATFTSPALARIAQSASSSLPRITSLLARPDISFSDQLVIQTVYMSITPLFVSEPAAKRKGKDVVGGGGKGVMKALRVEALGCLRGIFARYEDQRQWIVEEILSSMGKASETNNALAKFQLANGPSIHTVSALLLQLIQAAAFGVTKRVRKLRSNLAFLSLQGDTESQSLQKPVDDAISLEEEIKVCSESIESALKSAGIVAKYLVQRCVTSKGSKSSHGTDYKAVLDFFIADLLSVLYRPEWPGAAVYLTVLSRILIPGLEEHKTSDTATKSLALDYLGEIAAKLRFFWLETNPSPIPSLDEIIANADVKSVDTVSDKYKQIHTFLSTASREDGMYACSLDMSVLIWAQELHTAIKKSSSVAEKLAQERDEEAMETRTKLVAIEEKLRNILKSLWASDDNVFEMPDPNALTHAHTACVAISRSRTLQNAFGPILNALVITMGSNLINLRSKALKGLGTIVTIDPDVLAHPSVKEAIDERLSDTSPQVRDAAVELIGKYVVQKPTLSSDYYPAIAIRVSDSGLGVRKRVIKLLRGIFGTTADKAIRIDIVCKMFTLINDTDENIQELAIKTATEMLYPISPSQDKDSAGLLVDVVADFPSTTILEGGIAQIVKECEKNGQSAQVETTVETLFQRINDATERVDIDPLSHIRTIYILVTARSDLVDVSKAEILLSYLRRKPLNADEQASNEVILKIYRNCIPSMPRVASSFALKLSEQLIPMISAPTGGFPTLKETVACYCLIANCLTRDYTGVMRVLTMCEGRTRAMRHAWTTTGEAAMAKSPAAGVSLFICACIVEGCHLDEIAQTDSTVKAGLDKISSDKPLYEHLFESFLTFTKMPIPQQPPSLCLGSLFRAYPSLILREEAFDWMDDVFKGNDAALQGRLLSVINDFLMSEAEKKGGEASGAKGRSKIKAEGRGMDALIGSAVELSESGLSTAVVQRNIGHILAGAKSQHGPTQSAALDILGFTVNKGLYHPLQCLPILISLETSESEQVAGRALELHVKLHAKHSTLVNVRFVECAKSSYEYQRSITSEVSGQRDGIALLQGWYTLLSEKRVWRHDFLKQLCRVFDYDLAGPSPDVGLVLYICDNLAHLEYRLQEEVMTVVGILSGVVGGATGLVMVLETATMDGEGGDSLQEKKVLAAENHALLMKGANSQVGEDYSAEVVIHSSIVVGLAMMTKNYLLDVYNIPEDKCIKHVPGKKSSAGDKPAARRKEGVLDVGRMVCVRGCGTVDDFRTQRATFLEMAHEDDSLDEA